MLNLVWFTIGIFLFLPMAGFVGRKLFETNWDNLDGEDKFLCFMISGFLCLFWPIVICILLILAPISLVFKKLQLMQKIDKFYDKINTKLGL